MRKFKFELHHLAFLRSHLSGCRKHSSGVQYPSGLRGHEFRRATIASMPSELIRRWVS